MATKKPFTVSTENIADKFISGNNTNNINNINGTNNDNIYNVINVKNKSKHYDERGKRDERLVLLLDKQLKEDLRLLCNATGSKSVNDLIVTILLGYVEQPVNQSKLEQYKQLLNL